MHAATAANPKGNSRPDLCCLSMHHVMDTTLEFRAVHGNIAGPGPFHAIDLLEQVDVQFTIDAPFSLTLNFVGA